jgi:hypothetical protein
MRPATTLLACFAALAMATLTGCPEPETEDFGAIKIELKPINTVDDIFGGTTEIVVTMIYGECLTDFYLVQHPEYQQDGVEGGTLFDEWAGKLCDPGLEKVIDCDVTDIDQILIEDTNVYQLKVTYKVNDLTSLQLGYIHVGPFPFEEFASECEGRPLVELRSNGVIGRDAQGTQIWGIETLPGSTEAVAGQGAPLRVDVGPT